MSATVTVPLLAHLQRPDITAAIKAHGTARWPEEACGAITAEGFIPLANESPTPREAFSCCAGVAPLLAEHRLLALVHSHPTPAGQRRATQDWPSADDMAGQMEMDVPWGLFTTTHETASTPWWWGAQLEPPKLVGRLFRHGPSGTDGRGDCYAVVRDWFKLTLGVELPDMAREWEWWAHPEETPEHNLYDAHFEKVGFRTVPASEVRVGDCAMITIPTLPAGGRGTPITHRSSHGAVYVGNEMVLHHVPSMRSIIQPLGSWNKLVQRWVRHASQF